VSQNCLDEGCKVAFLKFLQRSRKLCVTFLIVMTEMKKESQNNVGDIDTLENDTSRIQQFFSELKGFSIETLRVVVISLVVIVAIRTFVMQPFFVSGKSMEPNFHDGDYLIVNEIAYRFGDPKRGDVIVFRYPKNPSEFFIKRIVGLPGEKIEIKDGRVKIYNSDHPEGMVLKEDAYLPPNVNTSGEYVAELKNDEYYVLGDNREASADSRLWGKLKRRFIIGYAWIRA